MLNYAAHAFGTVAGWGFGDGTFYDESTGEFEYAATNDGYKEMVEYFHGLVEDGLLDTESFTAANDGAGTVTEKFANESGVRRVRLDRHRATTSRPRSTPPVGEGNSELVADRPARRPGRSGRRAAQLLERLHADVAGGGRSELLADPAVPRLAVLQPRCARAAPLGRRRRDLHEGRRRHDHAEPGVLASTRSTSTRAPRPTSRRTSATSNDVLAGLDRVARAQGVVQRSRSSWSTSTRCSSTRTPRDPFPPAPLDEVELEQASLLATPLKDTVDTNTLRFILGDRDLLASGTPTSASSRRRTCSSTSTSINGARRALRGGERLTGSEPDGPVGRRRRRPTGLTKE